MRYLLAIFIYCNLLQLCYAGDVQRFPVTGNFAVSENFKDLYLNKANKTATVNITGNQSVAGNKTFTGFTAFGSGNTGIKVKKLTGDTANSEGGTTSVAHGLTGSKIIGWTVKVTYATNSGDTAGDLTPGYIFYSYHDATNFNVTLHATSSENVVSKGFTILVFYDE